MALIYDSRFRALDSSGNPIVGATLTVKDAGTSTLSSIYRDNGLTTPMTNPSSGADVSDAGGWFPQIFATEGALFDITLKTSAGVTVQSYEDVAAMGDGGADIERDFGNARLLITGSGGKVRFEVGDPTGDDTGGKAVISGWNSTQADTIELDGAAVSTTGTLDTGSTLTEDGKSLYGVVYDTGTVSAASEMIIPLANVPSGTTAWDIDIVGLTGTATNYILRVSTDNGSTYLSAANYAHCVFNGQTNLDSEAAAQTSSILLIGNANSPTLGARFRIVTSNTTGRTYWWGNGVATPVSGLVLTPYLTSGTYASDIARVTHIRIAPDAGTITGRWRVIPLRGL